MTGASGYVGGRLVPLLEQRGERLRCLARRPELLAGRFAAATELVAGDVLDPASLRRALAGVATAYYLSVASHATLVHSLGSRGRFEEEEEQAAQSFAGGAQRIIYLGGLVAAGTAVPGSAPMRSRLRAGEILRASGIPTVEFRTSIIIGAGSLSFEMIPGAGAAAADHGDAALGDGACAAHRHRRRARLPGGRPRPAAGRHAGVRDRRRRGNHLPRADAGVRAAARHPASVPAGAAAHAAALQPVARSGDPPLFRARRPQSALPGPRADLPRHAARRGSPRHRELTRTASVGTVSARRGRGSLPTELLDEVGLAWDADHKLRLPCGKPTAWIGRSTW